MPRINPELPAWMLTAPRFHEWSDEVVDLTPDWDYLCAGGKVDPQPELTRHPARNIPVETLDPGEQTMFPDDILAALGKETFPSSLYVLASVSEGHAVVRRNDGSTRVVGLVCFEARRPAELACHKPSHQHFSPLLVGFEDAIEIALAKEGVALQALILIRDPEEPLFHYVR